MERNDICGSGTEIQARFSNISQIFYLYLLSILLFVIYSSSITLQSLCFCLFFAAVKSVFFEQREQC